MANTRLRRSKDNKRRTSHLKPQPRKRSAISRPKRPHINTQPSNYKTTRSAITDLNIPPENRRSVLLDAENIAYNDITGVYSANRIYDAYQWFVSNGHRTLVLCPDYLSRKLTGSVPAMNIEIISGSSDGAENHSVNGPFELALLQRANDMEAAIVSERSFISTYHEFAQVVKERVIGFSFFRDSIFVPVDPYGRSGPWLRVILHK